MKKATGYVGLGVILALSAGVARSQDINATTLNSVTSSSIPEYSASTTKMNTPVGLDLVGRDFSSGYMRNFYSTSYTYAEVVRGGLKAIAEASGWGGPAVGSQEYASATASIRDSFVVNSPGLNGTQGTLTFSVAWASFEKIINVNNPYFSTGASFDGQVGGATWLTGTTVVNFGKVDTNAYTCLNGSCTNNYSPTLTLSTDFTFGSPVDVFIRITATALGGASSSINEYGDLIENSFHANVDAGHSGYWGGISSVSVNGKSLDDFNITSNSPIDWSQSYVPASMKPGSAITITTAVPEPSEYALLIAGIATIALYRARRPTKRRACSQMRTSVLRS